MSRIKPLRAIQLNKSNPLARGLSGCWIFNEGCGGLSADMSGNKLDIPVAGGTPEWTTGNHGSAIYFNNSENEYMELDIAPVKNFPCTILAWICPDDITQGNIFYPLYIANKDVADQSWGILLNYSNDGEVSFIANISISRRAVSSKRLVAGQWHQVVGVAASATDRRCFVDGGNKGTNSIAVNAPSGLNRISIGRAGDFTPGYYFPGKVGCVFVWNRVLSDTEIAWLYREPYAMFDTNDRAKSQAFSIAINPLAGQINAHSLIAGKLDTSNKTDKLEKFWLMDVLANGMSGNAFKLSTTLSMSWFWMRGKWCNALYRGTSIEQIDLENIIKIVDSDAERISPPDFCAHENDISYFYIVRRINKCGVMERTVRTIVKVSIDSNGNIEAVRPNAIFTSSAEVIQDNKVRLKWFYCPLEQKSQPACFRIYFDNGSGQVDYENPIAEIEYANRNDYEFLTQSLETKSYLFVIRTANSDGVENISSKKIRVQIESESPFAIEILDVKNI